MTTSFTCRPPGRRLSALVAAAVLAAACGGGASPSAGPVTLNALFMKQAAYSEDNVTEMTKAFEDANPNVTVNLEFVAYDALHDKIVTDQVGGAGSYDTVLLDAIWPAEFAKAKIVRDITANVPAEYKNDVFPSALAGGQYQGKFYAVPWINDTKFLFYNKQMLAAAGFSDPPATWDELLAQARAIKDKGIVDYPIVWSWSQAEAAICDWTQLAAVMGGADFVDDAGNARFAQGGPLAALEWMKKTLDDGLSNPASTGFLEEDVRNTFSAGGAAFALNWTYMYNLANDPQQSKVAGQVGVVASPGMGGVQTSGVNGGMGIAVTSSSKHPDEAVAYALWMASKPMQDKFAQLSLPMWKSSFQDAAITKTAPELFAAANVEFTNLVMRPVVPYYTALSSALQVALQEALTGKKPAAQALGDVAAKLPEIQK
ncbi:MAG: extracellular solute-binding protein [Chloroflexi bacterium]|nr:extracellular solute-binding protein [Chloroflexota bacterium]